jgi:thioredoxin 1
MAENVHEFTDGNFKSEVLESDTPVLVDFWAPWCGPCRMLGPTIEELANEHTGSVKVGKMNVDENQDTPGTYGVSAIPAVLLFKGGKVVDNIVGLQPKKRFEQAISQAQS